MRNIYLLLFMLIGIIKTKGQYQVVVQSGHTQPVIDIASGGVGNECLFTASMDGTIKVWEWKTGSLMGTLKSNNQSEIIAIQMNSQGFLLVIYSDGKIEWWDYYEKKIRYEMQVHYDVVEVIKPIATSKYLILDDEYNDDTLDLDSRKILNTRNSKWVDQIRFEELLNPIAGSNWIAGINTLNQGTFIDFSNESNPKKMHCLVEDTSDLLAICMLGGDTSLAMLSNNGYLHFFNKSGKLLFQQNTNNQNLKHLKSNNNELMVVASEKEVLAYNNSGGLLDTFSLQVAIERIEFIADDKILITTASTLSIYNLHTHKLDVEVKTRSSIGAYTYNSDLNLFVYVEKESPKPVVLDISHGIKLYNLTSPVWEAQQIYFIDSLNICLRNSKNECRMLNTSTGRISETENCTSPPLDESLFIDNNYISLSYPEITYDTIKSKKATRFVTYREIEITDFSGKAISSCFSTDSSKLYILNAKIKSYNTIGSTRRTIKLNGSTNPTFPFIH